jgi:homoserine kinase
VLSAPSNSPAADGLIYLSIRVPHQLRQAVEQHQHNLHGLVAALRQSGLPDALVRAHVDRVVESYRRALLDAVADIGRETDG